MDERLALAVGLIEGGHATAEAPACFVLVTIFCLKGKKNSEERKLE